MTDYSSLIDAETWAFIRATEAAYPADTSGFTMAEHRAAYDAMCAVFDAGRPAGLRVTDEGIAGVPCRIYHGRATQVVYFHGGGFYVGGLHSHDSICAEIAARTGFTVIAVDYRLSPEHDHPAAYDDAMAVTLALTGPFLLAGDSAGGNLAAAVSRGLRGHRRQALGQVLIYPGLGGDIDKGSYLTHANAPMLTRADVILGSTIRRNAPDDPSAVPLRDTDFSGLPPTLALAAECDPLADDAAAYTAAITAAGGQALALTEPGLVHGHLRARHSVARAGAAFTRVCYALTDMASGRWSPT
jgi:acetyl esterase